MWIPDSIYKLLPIIYIGCAAACLLFLQPSAPQRISAGIFALAACVVFKMRS